MTSCRPVTVLRQERERTAKLRFVPAVLEPTPDDWAPFCRADRNLLARLMRESLEYVDDPVLHAPGAEKCLFGKRALLAGNGTHFVEAPSSCKNAGGILKPSEEILLFQQFNYTRLRCQRLLRRFGRKRMPLDKLRLLLAWANRRLELRQRIVEANMPLVLGMTKRARITGLDLCDLVSEGNLALLRCVDKFDCSRGFKFSTYACRAILKSFARVGITTSRYRGRFPVTLDPTICPGDHSEQQHDEAESLCLDRSRGYWLKTAPC